MHDATRRGYQFRDRNSGFCFLRGYDYLSRRTWTRPNERLSVWLGQGSKELHLPISSVRGGRRFFFWEVGLVFQLHHSKFSQKILRMLSQALETVIFEFLVKNCVETAKRVIFWQNRDLKSHSLSSLLPSKILPPFFHRFDCTDSRYETLAQCLLMHELCLYLHLCLWIFLSLSAFTIVFSCFHLF